ncbi:hypothetical protein RB195_023145 [Necator americanus]|uniref:Reverse transcriptase domain-containing protein n=1 Tax=Necator americanus TaxID=51031 RepID=A0ABR1EI02_NECAM
MESLATTIRFVTLKLSSELQRTAVSRPHQYLCLPSATLGETLIRDWLFISIGDYTTHCGDADDHRCESPSPSYHTYADERKVGGCVVAVSNGFRTLLNWQTQSALELKHAHRPTCVVNEEPPTESRVLLSIQKMKNGKSGGDDRISAEMLKYLPPSGIREMTKIIPSIWIDERIPGLWRHATTIPLHKKLSVTDPRNYQRISLLRVMYKVLKRIILDRLIKHPATSKLAFVLT